jgi:hypothetical protein
MLRKNQLDYIFVIFRQCRIREVLLKKIVLLSGLLLAISQSALAMDWNVSGFASLVAGRIVSGESGDYMERVSGYDCPCFVGDFANVGVYEGKSWDAGPDSRAGVQLDGRFTDGLAFSTQVVGHGGDNMKPELSALYLSWQATDELALKLGRQRLPLFYYSDFYDVGYAYPWIRVPTDLYGWPINSYNGASLTYADDLGDGNFRLHLLMGEEEENDNRMYAKLYYGSKEFLTDWKNIVGLVSSYQYDWFDLRLAVISNDVYAVADYGVGGKYVAADHIRQDFAGFAFNVDYRNLLFRTEFNAFRQPELDFTSQAKMLSLGYRIGSVTPMLMYSRYDDDDADFGTGEARTRSVVVRWDFMKNLALKVQYDVIRDGSNWIDQSTVPVTVYDHFVGNTRLFALGVDYVF